MREPCLCGALDCVACRGPSAKYANWCDECEYIDECGDTTSHGDDECQRQCDAENAVIDAYEARMDARRDREWDR